MESPTLVDSTKLFVSSNYNAFCQFAPNGVFGFASGYASAMDSYKRRFRKNSDQGHISKRISSDNFYNATTFVTKDILGSRKDYLFSGLGLATYWAGGLINKDHRTFFLADQIYGSIAQKRIPIVDISDTVIPFFYPKFNSPYDSESVAHGIHRKAKNGNPAEYHFKEIKLKDSEESILRDQREIYKPMMEAYMHAQSPIFGAMENRVYRNDRRNFRCTNPFTGETVYTISTSLWERVCLFFRLETIEPSAERKDKPIFLLPEARLRIEKFSIRRYNPVYKEAALAEREHSDRIQLTLPDDLSLDSKDLNELAIRLAQSSTTCDIIIMQEYSTEHTHRLAAKLVHLVRGEREKQKIHGNALNIVYFDINSRNAIDPKLSEALDGENIFTIGMDNPNQKEGGAAGLHFTIPQSKFKWMSIPATFLAMASKEIQEDLLLFAFGKLWDGAKLKELLSISMLYDAIWSVPKTALKITAFPVKVVFYTAAMIYMWATEKNKSVFEIPTDAPKDATKYSIQSPTDMVFFSNDLKASNEKERVDRKNSFSLKPKKK